MDDQNLQQVAQDSVDNSYQITIYTTPTCQFCRSEKEYLVSKGLKFEEKSVEDSEDNLKEMLSVSANFAGVPVTVLKGAKGDSVVVKGFTKEDFEAELKKVGIISAVDEPKPTAPSPAADTPAADTSEAVATDKEDTVESSLPKALTDEMEKVEQPKTESVAVQQSPAVAAVETPTPVAPTPVAPVTPAAPAAPLEPKVAVTPEPAAPVVEQPPASASPTTSSQPAVPNIPDLTS